MKDSCSFILKRYQQTDSKPVEGELIEIIKFERLPGNFDFDSFQRYLESEKARDITNSYYNLERVYSHSEMGAGGSAEEIILDIWNDLPDFVKEHLVDYIIKFAELGFLALFKKFKTSKKKKLSSIELKQEKYNMKKEYNFSFDEATVQMIENTDIKIKTFRRIKITKKGRS